MILAETRLAAAIILLLWLRVADVGTRRTLRLLAADSQAGLDVGRHPNEGLLDVRGVLRARLKERDAERVGEVLCHLRVNSLLGHQVALVADKDLVHVLAGVLLNLAQPSLDVVEALHVRRVVYNDNAVRAAVVATRDRAEALLTGGIPNLQFDHLAVKVQRADLEVHANGGDVAISVAVVGKAKQQAGLANAAVADKQQLEQVVVLGSHLLFEREGKEKERVDLRNGERVA